MKPIPTLKSPSTPTFYLGCSSRVSYETTTEGLVLFTRSEADVIQLDIAKAINPRVRRPPHVEWALESPLKFREGVVPKLSTVSKAE